VAKAILVEAISEGNYGHLSPRKVVISQAVLLAKQYLDPGQHKVINAVLDKSLTAYECPEN
jgi:transcription termination factor NusB